MAQISLFFVCFPLLHPHKSLTNLPEFANVLEQLETTFYNQALSKFQESDFTTAGFSNAQVPIEQFTSVSLPKNCLR